MTIKFRQESVNVRDFGAKGNGVVDDAPAFQAALDASIGSGYARGRKVFVPKGDYKFNSTVYLRRQVALIGETAGSFFSSAVILPAKNITAFQVDFESLVSAPERRGGGSIIENFKIVYGFALPTIWQASTAYAAGALVVSQPGADDYAGQVNNPVVSDLYTMECTTAGISGASTPDLDLRAVTSISRTGNIVTVVTTLAHGVLPGKVVYMLGQPDPNFPTGRFTISTTPAANQFTYFQAGPDVPSGVGTFSFIFGGGWDSTPSLILDGSPRTLAEGSTIIDGTVQWTVRVIAGVRMHAGAQLKSVWVEGSPGNGFLLAANVGWNPYSNINNFSVENCVANSGAMHGLFVQGADANAGNVRNFLAISNRRWGIYDHSFLGNTYVGCNGSTNVDLRNVVSIVRAGTTVTVTMVGEHGLLPGNIVGQWNDPDANFPRSRWPVLATPTAHSFTYSQSGPAGSGMTSIQYMIGGGAFKAYDFNARNTFLGCYSEGDQFGSEIASPSTVLGGIHASSFKEGGSSAAMQIDGQFTTANGTLFSDFRYNANPKRVASTVGQGGSAIHFSSASEGVKFLISSLTRVSGIVTVVTTTPHGFQQNQSRFITAVNDPNFAGGLKTILGIIGGGPPPLHVGSTSFTYLEAGADATPGLPGHYALGDGGGTGFALADDAPSGMEGWWIWRHANLDGRMFMAWSGNLASSGPGKVWFPQGVLLGGAGAYQSLLEFSKGPPSGWAAPIQKRGSLRLEADPFPQAGFELGIFGYQFIDDGIGDGVQILRWPHFGWKNQIDVTNGVGSPFAIDWKKHAGATFTNEGATAKVYLTLQQSTGIPDLRCTEHAFFVKDSDGLRFTASAFNTLRWGNRVTVGGGYLESTTVGSWIKIKLVGTLGAPEWLVTEFAGEWTDGVFQIENASSAAGVLTLTSTTLTVQQLDATITNTGAVALAIYTLPATPSVGDRYMFMCDDTDGIRVLANAGQTINIGGSLTTVAGNLQTTTVGAALEIMYLATNKWVARTSTGPWAVV